MRRISLVGLLLFSVALLPLFGLNATVKQVTGRVQLLPPGGSWVDAEVGSLVTPGTVVSTGFGSTAVLDLGTSQVQVKQLTRLKLSELLRSQSTATTSLFLTVGAVKADVADNLGITQKFTVQSPVSTAAVRGTILGVSDGGYGGSCDRGTMHFSNSFGLGVLVGANESSELNGPYVPRSPQEFAAAASQVSIQTQDISLSTLPSAGAATQPVTITVTAPGAGG